MSTGVSSKIYLGSSEFILDNSGSITSSRTFITAPTGICAVWEKVGSANGALHYIHTDNQGSWLKITSESATIENTYSYDAWGRPRNPSTWALKPISITNALGNLNDMQPRFDRGYTGHEHMAGFGLINMNGRLYDPYLQRFLSPDPFVKSPDNAQNYNRYTYCLNNPLAYTDPTGYNQEELKDNGFKLSDLGYDMKGGWGVIKEWLHGGCFSGITMPTPQERGMDKPTSGHVYYGEAFGVGVAYNNFFNSWGNTAAGNYTNAQYAYDTGSIPLTSAEEWSILDKEYNSEGDRNYHFSTCPCPGKTIYNYEGVQGLNVYCFYGYDLDKKRINDDQHAAIVIYLSYPSINGKWAQLVSSSNEGERTPHWDSYDGSMYYPYQEVRNGYINFFYDNPGRLSDGWFTANLKLYEGNNIVLSLRYGFSVFNGKIIITPITVDRP